MAYSDFHTPELDDCVPAVFDSDGTSLYEGNYNNELLRTIIKRNDIDKLKQYVLGFSRHGVLYSSDLTWYDPFWMAASYGNTDIFRFLLEQYHLAQADDATPLDQRKFSLLHTACRAGNVDMARFFLDSQPPFGTISARDEEDETPLLSAASSLFDLPVERTDERADEIAERNKQILQSEQLLNLLLDRGACAQDSRHPYPDSDIVETVLGLAISRGSSALVKRLLDQGADPYIKQSFFNSLSTMGFGDRYGWFKDASVLHMASLFWNVEGIKALIDHHTGSFADLVSSRDSHGHLPLHYAAGRRDIANCEYPDDEISLRLVETFRLLLSGNRSAINARDEQGLTPLYHTIKTHVYCVKSRHAELAVRFLLEHGADAAILDSSGQTTLHLLAKSPGPVNTVLLDLLIAHGADVNHVDNDGNKPLHDMARNLRQTQATRFLCTKGADVSATNAHGDTAFHKAAEGVMASEGVIGSEGILRADKCLKKGQAKPLTSVEMISAQDEMMAILQTAFGGDEMMNQRNNAGKTPRDLQKERRSMWQDPMRAFRGRGRGYPRS